jgi:hypothetical protein
LSGARELDGEKAMLKEGRVLILVFLCSGFSACHKAPSKVAVPTPPPMILPAPPSPMNKLELGEQQFIAGNYEEATRLLEAFLAENANAAGRDKASFRLGVAYALTAKTPPERARAEAQLKLLVSQYPQSDFRPQAELILSLESDIEQLRRDIFDRDNKILDIAEQLHLENTKASEREKALRDREEKIKERDEKIRKLTQELDQLKKIDLQRRPSLPPQ